MYTIRTDIPHGNACCIELIDEAGVPAIHFVPDPHGGTETLWFCLRAERTEGRADLSRLRIVMDNPGNSLGIHSGAAPLLHPVMRQDDSAWVRLPGGEMRACPDGQASFVWEVDAPKSYAEFAFCFPHGPAEVETLLAETDGAFHRDVIGVTQKARPMVRLVNDYGTENGTRPGIYCISHQHASEMSGAWVCDGFLRRMAECGDSAPLVWSVPVTNVDGVVEGDYGKDPFPWDLNRAWGSPPMRHETLVLQQDIANWKTRCRPLFAMDFHSPGGAETEGLYTFLPKDETRYARIKPWAESIQNALGAWGAEPFIHVADYPSRFGRPSFCQACMDLFDLEAMTTETPYHRVGEKVLTIADYQTMGACMADGVMRHIATLGA